jgi:hypothetical protein
MKKFNEDNISFLIIFKVFLIGLINSEILEILEQFF